MIKVLKNTGLHILGYIAGCLSDAIAYAILKLVIVDLIGSIPLITAIISYPVGYEWYAIITVFLGAAFVGIHICNRICKISKTKYNYGLIAFAITYTIDFISRMFNNFSNNGFSFSALILYLIVIATYIFGSWSLVVSEE